MSSRYLTEFQRELAVLEALISDGGFETELLTALRARLLAAIEALQWLQAF